MNWRIGIHVLAFVSPAGKKGAEYAHTGIWFEAEECAIPSIQIRCSLAGSAVNDQLPF